MRYNPRTDNAMDMDEIARQCMAAVIAATDHPVMMSIMVTSTMAMPS